MERLNITPHITPHIDRTTTILRHEGISSRANKGREQWAPSSPRGSESDRTDCTLLGGMQQPSLCYRSLAHTIGCGSLVQGSGGRERVVVSGTTPLGFGAREDVSICNFVDNKTGREGIGVLFRHIFFFTANCDVARLARLLPKSRADSTCLIKSYCSFREGYSSHLKTLLLRRPLLGVSVVPASDQYLTMTIVCPVGLQKPNYKSIVGRCYCGAIEWQLVGKVNFTSTCHCTDCQAISGSAYGETALMIYDRKSH